MLSFETPVVSIPGRERLARHAHCGKIIIHATAEETGGVLGMWETFTEPGKGPSPHVHRHETDVFRVMSGSYRFWCGETCFDGGPGTIVTLPPHVPHAWRNIGDTPGQMFAIVTPGGFEGLFIEIERRGGCTYEEFVALEGTLGVSEIDLDMSLGPPGTPVLQLCIHDRAMLAWNAGFLDRVCDGDQSSGDGDDDEFVRFVAQLQALCDRFRSRIVTSGGKSGLEQDLSK